MPAYMPVEKSKTTVVTNKQRKEAPAKIYVGKNGYIQNAGYTIKPIPALERGSMIGPKAIVLHRIVSTTASGPLASFQNGLGTHFLIDKDGTTYQTASINFHTSHIGPIRSRCFVEGTCSVQEASKIGKMSPIQGHRYEKIKPYPARYPINDDSIGIEVVGMYQESAGLWDPATDAQRDSVSRLVGILKKEYSLTDADIYEHDKISRKTAGEGAGLYNSVDLVPIEPSPPAR